MAEISLAAQIDPSAAIGVDVTIAPGAVIGAGAALGDGVSIGANTVVHRGVRLGAGCVIEDLVVLGKRPRLRAGSSAAAVELSDLELGPGVTVCCGAVVYAGASVGAGSIIGDQAQVREGSRIGERSVVGRASCVDFNATVGNRVSIQTGVYVTSWAVVEDDVFLGPGVLMTNDDTMGRHAKGERLHAPVIRRAARVGGATVLVPGVEVGEEAFVGAGAVVTHDVAPRDVVLGLPARAVRQVDDTELIERWR
ncbi:MAG TPA: DapH/DapD/GlmU-related protein [Solirubrobacteraceae bacterium]|jgi:UDP-3-O-[3-hydroxymyristoyl] glucosamine N-acyltransferase|nr:DapH/DapD/GlmU-related protein [Solirubrobacteraceae bacterium]